jgi:hypothetical protein
VYGEKELVSAVSKVHRLRRIILEDQCLNDAPRELIQTWI